MAYSESLHAHLLQLYALYKQVVAGPAPWIDGGGNGSQEEEEKVGALKGRKEGRKERRNEGLKNMLCLQSSPWPHHFLPLFRFSE